MDKGDPLLNDQHWAKAIEAATARPRLTRIDSAGFDLASEHVFVLLSDATQAFYRKSYGTAVFLAITGLEETGKIITSGFQKRAQPSERPKGRDPLRDHATKHKLGLGPVLFMGERLLKVLGREQCETLKREVDSGSLVALREASIYVNLDVVPPLTPQQVVNREKAFAVLLMALEAADDGFVGFTNASFDLGKRFEILVRELEARRVE